MNNREKVLPNNWPFKLLAGFIFYYIASFALILAIKGFSLENVIRFNFLFVFSSVSPLLAISYNFLFILNPIILVLILYLQIKYIPSNFLYYTFAATFLVWGVYGIKMMVLVTGGA